MYPYGSDCFHKTSRGCLCSFLSCLTMAGTLSPGLGGFRYLHRKHEKLVIKCVITIVPNHFSTYSYSHACILCHYLIQIITFDYFIHLGFFFPVWGFSGNTRYWIYGEFGLLDCFKMMPFVPLASTYRKTGTYRIQTER